MIRDASLENTSEVPYARSFCCCGNIPNEACGWPERTVRALLAIIVLIFGLGVEAAVALWLLHSGETSLAISVIALIGTEVTGVTAYYFGLSKSSTRILEVGSDSNGLQQDSGDGGGIQSESDSFLEEGRNQRIDDMDQTILDKIETDPDRNRLDDPDAPTKDALVENAKPQ